MAIIKGIFQFNGKLGDAVGMKGEDGKNYTRIYRDKIANPNTDRQVTVRTKMVLAGKLSKLTDKDLILGISGASNRKRRSAFMKNILKSITVSVVDGVKQAVLEPNRLVLSEGGYQGLPTITGTSAGGTLTVTTTASAWDNFPGLKAIVLAVYNVQSGVYTEAMTDVITKTAPSASFSVGTTVDCSQVYAIPVVEGDSTSTPVYPGSIIALANSNKMAVQTTFSESEAAQAYRNSRFEGTITPTI